MQEKKTRITELNLVTANARSIELKLPSLIDIFKDCDISVALITETWIKPNNNYDRIKEELEMNHGLKIIACNRAGKKRGGGLAIIYDPSIFKLNENKFVKNGIEAVSAQGKLIGDNRNFVFYSVYLPPNIKKHTYDCACEVLNDSITEVKTKLESPIIIIAGDFNQFGANGCITDHPEIAVTGSPPTRKDCRLDLFASNIEEHIAHLYVVGPLHTTETLSDHLPLICQIKLPNAHRFQIVKYKTRKYTKKKEEKFAEEMNDSNWDTMLSANTASEKTVILHERINYLMDKFFPLKSYSVKSTDKPWVNDHSRKEMRKRKVEYRKNGKSERI